VFDVLLKLVREAIQRPAVVCLCYSVGRKYALALMSVDLPEVFQSSKLDGIPSDSWAFYRRVPIKYSRICAQPGAVFGALGLGYRMCFMCATVFGVS